VFLLQFNAILEGLVVESVVINQAEWMQMEVREQLGQQHIKRRTARIMITKWNRYGS